MVHEPLHIRASKLSNVLESAHFRIRYGFRNSDEGGSLTPDGVRDNEIVLHYGEILEAHFDIMMKPPWSRPLPVTGPSGKIIVYLLRITEPFTDIGPFIASDRGKAPYIVLPCGSDELTNELEKERATAEAVHELTHVFNYKEHPLDLPHSVLWRWFDEGLAVYMEKHAFKDNKLHFSYFRDWVQSPRTPLDHENFYYQAFVFIRFLANKYGESFVNRVWTESGEMETPFDTINRLIAEMSGSATTKPGRLDIFHEYGLHGSYLCGECDLLSHCFGNEMFERFGDRTITHSFRIGAGATKSGQGSLDHLTCDYYRFTVSPDVKALEAGLFAVHGGNFPLKAELAAITEGRFKGNAALLHPMVTNSRGKAHFQGELKVEGIRDLRHVILVVSNCGVRAERPYHDHDDRIGYRIQVTAA